MRSTAKRQYGVTLIGFLFMAALVGAVGIVAFRAIPIYNEYFTVQKMLRNLDLQNNEATPTNLRDQFDRRASADTPLRLPPPDPGSVWNQFVLRVPEGRRDALAAHLAAQGIDTAVYYPTPLHLQRALAHLGGRSGQLPRAEAACGEVLAVPAHAELTAEEIGRVCDAVVGFFD